MYQNFQTWITNYTPEQIKFVVSFELLRQLQIEGYLNPGAFSLVRESDYFLFNGFRMNCEHRDSWQDTPSLFDMDVIDISEN
jgi:hypothetical protein